MSDVRELLRAADGGPPGPVDHDEIRRRGRRLIAARIAGIAGVVAAVGVAGGLALQLTGDEPSPPVIEQPSPAPSPSAKETETERADDGAGDAAFVPPTRLEDGQRVVRLRFADGTVGEIAYPAEVDIHERGTSPAAVLSILADERDPGARMYGRPRISVPVEFHLGARDEVLRDLNGGNPPELVAEYPGPDGGTVPLYDTSGGDYFAWQAGPWTLLVPDPTGSFLGAEPRDPEENRGVYAANLHVDEDPDGWPIMTAEPPLMVHNAAVTLGDPEADSVTVEASACGSGRPGVFASSGGRKPSEGEDVAGWCDAPTQLEFRVIGSVDFVDSLADGLEARSSQYPPNVIDPSWVTEEEKGAWQAEHGDGTWVVGYFFPPDIWDHDLEEWPEVLEPRWKRISDEELGHDREAELREALAALTGPPPPRLGNLWQLRVLDLTSAELDGSELVLDFHVVFAAAEGSSGDALMGAQFDAVAHHYYPEADSICVLEGGEPFVWLHDRLSCPSRDLGP